MYRKQAHADAQELAEILPDLVQELEEKETQLEAAHAEIERLQRDRDTVKSRYNDILKTFASQVAAAGPEDVYSASMGRTKALEPPRDLIDLIYDLFYNDVDKEYANRHRGHTEEQSDARFRMRWVQAKSVVEELARLRR